MNMNDVKKKAASLEIKTGRMRKADLIRTIQLQEGNSACFQAGITSCDQNDCCWRSDCDQ